MPGSHRPGSEGECLKLRRSNHIPRIATVTADIQMTLRQCVQTAITQRAQDRNMRRRQGITNTLPGLTPVLAGPHALSRCSRVSCAISGDGEAQHATHRASQVTRRPSLPAVVAPPHARSFPSSVQSGSIWRCSKCIDGYWGQISHEVPALAAIAGAISTRHRTHPGHAWILRMHGKCNWRQSLQPAAGWTPSFPPVIGAVDATRFVGCQVDDQMI